MSYYGEGEPKKFGLRKDSSKNCSFRSPERWAGQLLQRFSRHGIDRPWYFSSCPKKYFNYTSPPKEALDKPSPSQGSPDGSKDLS